MGANHPPGLPASVPGDSPRLVVHLVDALDSAHLENGLLNLIRHLPPERYRHAIVCLHDRGDYQAGIREHGVDVVNLHKRDGGDFLHYLRMFRVLRRLQPDLIHTRNGSGLKAQIVAALAGVPLRVHAEHGRQFADADAGQESGQPAAGKRRHQAGRTVEPFGARLLRRLLCPLIDHFIAVSSDLEQWLVESVGAEPARVSQIANGVDSVQFHPRLGPAAAIGPPGFMHDNAFVIGSVGRMDDSANHATLVEAFLRLIASPHPAHARLRLLIVGDGPARAECQALLNRAGAAQRAWLPGTRADLAQLMRAMDLFVLPSLVEDRSNAILEAMASGLPVVSTAVGGIPDLVQDGVSGALVPPRDAAQLATALAAYVLDEERTRLHGAAGRARIEQKYSVSAMLAHYVDLYDGLRKTKTPLQEAITPCAE